MKREAWRRDPAAYPFQTEIAPRWSDVDTLRHLNNVALMGLHGEARMRWLADTVGHSGVDAAQPALRPVSVATDFVAQAHYPAPLRAGVRLRAVDDAGFELATALFQHGQCVGLAATRMAAWQHGQPGTLPKDLRAQLTRCLADQAALPPPPAEHPHAHDAVIDHHATPPDLAHAPPHWHGMTTRYADLDAHQGLGELALARLVEHTRLRLLRRAMSHRAGDGNGAPALGFLVAHMRLQLLHPGWAGGGAWQIGAGVAELGRSAIRLRSWVRDPRQLVAVADTVLVSTDPVTQRAAPMDDITRGAMQALAMVPLTPSQPA